MLLVPVISSNLMSIGYDPDLGELQVQFRHGGEIYSYQNVTPDVYNGLVTAPSKGTYFGTMIRAFPNLYQPQRVA